MAEVTPPPLVLAQRRLAAATILCILLAALIAWLAPLGSGAHPQVWKRVAAAAALLAPIFVFLLFHALVAKLTRRFEPSRSSVETTSTNDLRALADDAAAADPRWRDGDGGSQARFTYVDQHGEVTERKVRNWISAGPYIEAHCLTRRAHRTFRKDRIEAWTPH